MARRGLVGAVAAVAPQAAEAQVLVDGQLGDDAAALGHVGDAARDQLLDRHRRQVVAVGRSTRPDVGRSSPESVRSRVVLPAPLAPSTAVIVPGCERQVDTSCSTGAPP